jgi:rhodanese-related sulfurtransferase
MKLKITLVIMTFLASLNLFAYMQTPNTKDQPLTADLYRSGIKIIDIRTESEWKQTGIVNGSHTITFFDEKGKYNANSFLTELNKIVSKDEHFAIICRSGNRTGTLSKFLKKAGYPFVIDIKGGIIEARKNGIQLVPYTK